MRGLAVTLTDRVLSGWSTGGDPLWSETKIVVDNVLVGEPSPEEVAASTGVPGRRLSYILGIPKGDTTDWKARDVSWAGPDGRPIHARTFGDPVSGVEHLIPTPWHRKVRCYRYDPDREEIITLWSAGQRVVLFGTWLTVTDSIERTDLGKAGTGSTALILPPSYQAYVGTQLVTLVKPKAFAAMTPQKQALHFTIDDSAFFAVGNIVTGSTPAKYQTINAAYDDVYRVSGVAWRNDGTDEMYLEVTGR